MFLAISCLAVWPFIGLPTEKRIPHYAKKNRRIPQPALVSFGLYHLEWRLLGFALCAEKNPPVANCNPFDQLVISLMNKPHFAKPKIGPHHNL